MDETNGGCGFRNFGLRHPARMRTFSPPGHGLAGCGPPDTVPKAAVYPWRAVTIAGRKLNSAIGLHLFALVALLDVEGSAMAAERVATRLPRLY